MSTFTLEEVAKLQAGGNEARGAPGAAEATGSSARRARRAARLAADAYRARRAAQAARAKYLATFKGQLPDVECAQQRVGPAHMRAFQPTGQTDNALHAARDSDAAAIKAFVRAVYVDSRFVASAAGPALVRARRSTSKHGQGGARLARGSADGACHALPGCAAAAPLLCARARALAPSRRRLLRVRRLCRPRQPGARAPRDVARPRRRHAQQGRRRG